MDRDETQRIPLSYLPSADEVYSIVRRFPGISVGAYLPDAGPREPWLYLDVRGRVEKVTDCYELSALESVLRRISSGAQEHLECPSCGYSLMRPSKPIGETYCAGCYRARRAMVLMMWVNVKGGGAE